MHKIRVRNIYIYDSYGPTYNLEITQCPKDNTCAIWRTCLDPTCPLTESPWESDLDDEKEAHGQIHRYNEGDWVVADTPHNCAAYWIEDWGDLDEFVTTEGEGVYSFKLDYLGDGYWVPFDFEKE